MSNQTVLQRKLSSTDAMLEVIGSNLGEIKQILVSIKAERSSIDPEKTTEGEAHMIINSVNASAAMIETCLNTVISAMYASGTMGNNPADHVEHFFNRQMKVLRGCYRDEPTRVEVLQESK